MNTSSDRNIDNPASYRFSHMDRGADYDDNFKTISHRALMWELERETLDRILSGHLRADIHHLDFACGTGRILQHLARATRTSVGVDVSDNMLAVAKTNAPRATLVQQDLTRDDSLGDRTFNLITAFRFFPNAEQELRASAMQVLARHLAPGGILVTNNHRKSHSAAHWVFRMLKPGRTPWMRPGEMETLFTDSGLEVCEIHPIGVLPFFDSFMPLSPARTGSIERAAMRHAWLKPLAQNWIYVCRKAASNGQDGRS